MANGVHEVLNRAQGALFGYALALARNRDDAADLLQEAALRALSAGNAPTEERALRNWLVRVMRNLWIDRQRASRRRAELGAALDAEVVPTGAEEMLVAQLSVRAAFLSLSADHRDVLALVDICGFSYGEVAETLDLPRGTVMSRVSRARSALADVLSDDPARGRMIALRRNRRGV